MAKRSKKEFIGSNWTILRNVSSSSVNKSGEGKNARVNVMSLTKNNGIKKLKSLG